MHLQSFDLKGSLFTLSVLHINNNDLQALKADLSSKINQAPGFFHRAPIVANLELIEEDIFDFAALNDILTSLNLVFFGITSTANAALKALAKDAGFAVLTYSKEVPVQQKAPSVEPTVKIVEKPTMIPAKIVENNIRSGQQVYAKGGDLIVYGSVGHGAEAIADGNIHIYGSLRGRAIAGAQSKPDDNQDARIFCQNMQAELVSVCGNYLLSEQLQGEHWSKPASIRLIDNKLSITALNKV